MDRPFEGVVIGHAAVYGGMIVNFGRHFAEELVAGGLELLCVVSRR